MKFFLLFLLTCMFGGMFTRHVPISTLRWAMLGLCMLIAFCYYFLRVI